MATVLGLTWVCSVLGVSDGDAARSLPCPNANDISPCVCTVKEDFTMDMDCSGVSSSNELSWIFSNDFPFLDFDNLIIRGNEHIRSLRVGDLGQATFQRINITDGTLESVVHGALEYSYGTLVSLDLSANHVTDFPFDEISSFTNIDELDFRYNALDTFPHIHSSTLRSFQMGYNPLKTIGVTTLNDLPNLRNIGLQGAELSSLQAGTFTGIPKLEVIELGDNQLTTLLADTIHVTGTANRVHLNSNNLVNIEVNAITGANFEVWVNENELVELNEDVWRPMFDDNIRLSARDNPFACGCEMAWIVLNSNYLHNLMDDPYCTDGTLIHDLDPAIFNELCT